MTRFLAALAFMAFGFGGMLVLAAEKNHKWWLRRQEQLPRFQKVRATVLDTGLGERGRWIRFTCRTGAGDVGGSRVSSSGSQADWQGFEKGRDYDAFHDPVFEECVLLVDEEVQAVDPELRASREAARWFAGLGAAFGLLAFGLAVARRRSAAQPRAPADAAAPERRINRWFAREYRLGGIGEAVFLAVLRIAVLALPVLLLFIRPVVVYRCEPKDGAASCVVERRAGGLWLMGRTEVSGIRRAEASTTTTRFTTHEPGRQSQTYNTSSSVGGLTLLGANGGVLYSEEVDAPVGRSGEWLAGEINQLAEGGRRIPFLAWRTTWVTTLFATVLVFLLATGFIAVALRRLRPRTDARRALLVAFVFVLLLCSMAWALAILGRFPGLLAEALGVPPGV